MNCGGISGVISTIGIGYNISTELVVKETVYLAQMNITDQSKTRR